MAQRDFSIEGNKYKDTRLQINPCIIIDGTVRRFPPNFSFSPGDLFTDMNTLTERDLSNLEGSSDPGGHYHLIPNAALIRTPFLPPDEICLVDYTQIGPLGPDGNPIVNSAYCKRPVDTRVAQVDYGFNTQAAVLIPQSAYQAIPTGTRLFGKRVFHGHGHPNGS